MGRRSNECLTGWTVSSRPEAAVEPVGHWWPLPRYNSHWFGQRRDRVIDSVSWKSAIEMETSGPFAVTLSTPSALEFPIDALAQLVHSIRPSVTETVTLLLFGEADRTDASSD